MTQIVGYISAPAFEFPHDRKYCLSDDNFPIDPKDFRNRLRESIRSLDVGESIWTDVSRFVTASNARGYAKKFGYEITIRQQERGIRIWRTR